MNNDQHLVSEQQGFTKLIKWIVVAAFLAIAIRAVTNPQRLISLTRQAAQRVHRDVRVQLSNAHLSFADGIFPRIAVEIHNISMEVDNTCWMNPRVFIDEMRVPISLFRFIFGGEIVEEIEIENIKMQFLSREILCVQSLENSTVKLTPSHGGVAAVINPTNIRGRIKHFLINHFEIEHPALTEQVAIDQIDFNVTKFAPFEFELKAKTYFWQDQGYGDYLLTSNFNVEYKDQPDRAVTTHFYGHWREGHYSLILTCLLTDQHCQIDSQVKLIPLGQILRVLKKYEFIQDQVFAKQAWLSFAAKSQFHLKQPQLAQVQVNDLSLEGDWGEIAANDLQISQIYPLRFLPTEINLNQLQIGKMLAVFNRQFASKNLSQLGNFTGKIELKDQQQMLMNGLLSNLEFVVTNRGVRETQIVKNVNVDMSVNQAGWGARLDHWVLDQGTLDGEVTLKSSQLEHRIFVNAEVNELNFNPKIQDLISQSGELAPLSFSLKAVVEDQKMVQLNGDLQTRKLNLSNVVFDRIKMQIGMESGLIKMGLQSHLLTIPKTSFLGSAMEELFSEQEELIFKDLKLILKTPQFKAMNFQVLKTNDQKHRQYLLEGGWSEEGQLNGILSVKTSKETERYLLTGQKNKPILVRR